LLEILLYRNRQEGGRGALDKKLIRELYELYGKEIYLYLYSMSHNSSLSEDLRQETFLKAILSLSETHTNMRAWLYMVARNLYYNQLKKDNRILIVEEIPNLDVEHDVADILEYLIANESRRHLYSALKTLPQQKREVLTMQYFGNLTQREIAGVLHITSENVRVLSYRAKQELRRLMEENQDDLS
jgi:RNA polymerase sigma-70 factor (ECF subfamily)